MPLIIDTQTGFPARVAMRWAIRRWQEGVSLKSIYRYCRPVLHAYEWALRQPGVGDLDLYLTKGYVLSDTQLDSLKKWVDTAGRPHVAGAIRGNGRTTVSDPAVTVLEFGALHHFLRFALDPAQRKGGPSRAPDLDAVVDRLAAAFDVPPPETVPRKTPGGRLLDAEVEAVRALIACPDAVPGEGNPFDRWTAFRNWLLFEVALATGFRVSELAALTVASVPRGRDLMSLRDVRGAAWDPRLEDPGSKTFGRDIPISDDLIVMLWEYLNNTKQPWGRSPRARHPSLWTTRSGEPLSVRQIARIFCEIGIAVGFRVTPHRPRHRFVYNLLDRMDTDTACELSGHSSARGIRPYAAERQREQAQEQHRAGYEATAAFLRAGSTPSPEGAA